jgi:hypothetical protein
MKPTCSGVNASRQVAAFERPACSGVLPSPPLFDTDDFYQRVDSVRTSKNSSLSAPLSRSHDFMLYEDTQPIEWFDSEWEFDLVQRINAGLIDQDEMIWRSEPDSMMEIQYGEFYKTDVRYNFIVEWHIDIDELARELGVRWETVNA